MRRAALVLLMTLTLHQASAAEPSYREPFRPQFHFTPAKNWMNDPNGMVFFDGEYHLFYQYNPSGDKWGHMSWGHAVSKDLVQWEHLPLALAEENKVMIFSGSAVVDWDNTSGFGVDDKPPLVAIYTGHHTDKKRQDQRIAYSNDRGRTWTKWSENPVLDIRKADFRDPKVIWHEGTKQWVMVVSHPIDRQVGFYGSPDLKHWRPLSEFGPEGSATGIWECPDLFPLYVDGNYSDQKWVLVVNVGVGAPAGGSGCQYFVGEFDGRTFTADKKTHPAMFQDKARLPPGDVFEDFENGYGGWVPTGDAFGKEPATGALDGQQNVDGFLGKAFVNSFHNKDRGTGTLTSPEFEIATDFINFMIGGGAHKGKTGMNLIVDGKVARTATGSEAERPSWTSWDAKELRGKTATLQIVDRETGGWGHVNIDHIMFSDVAVKPRESEALWADFGRDFYAAVSWSDIPKADGRRIWIGWMSNWNYAQDVPTAPWRSAMTVPRTLGLKETAKGYRLTQEPVKELADTLLTDRIRSKVHPRAGAGRVLPWPGESQLIDLDLDFAGITDGADFGLRVHGAGGELLELRYKADKLSLDRTKSGKVGFHKAFPGVHTAPCAPEDGKLSIRVLLDTSSVEVFSADGTAVITDLFFPTAGGYSLELFSAAGAPEPHLTKTSYTLLKSAW